MSFIDVHRFKFQGKFEIINTRKFNGYNNYNKIYIIFFKYMCNNFNCIYCIFAYRYYYSNSYRKIIINYT